jgi:hypoxanthine phosphoribosyltransferase
MIRTRKKLYYTWKEYDKDINHIVCNYKFDMVVALYRGSLPIATHLTNVTNATMSIIKYQSYKNQTQLITTKKPEWILDNSNESTKKVLVIDDICDTGNTMNLTNEFLRKKYPKWDITYLTIFGKANDSEVEYLREINGQWIVFPWELIWFWNKDKKNNIKVNLIK